MAKLLPITLRAASLTLTGSLVAVVGTVSTDCASATSGAAKLGFTTAAFVRVSYTRHASSTTGRPILAIDVSMDDPSTAAASVANWQTVQLMDGASFASGAAETVPYLMVTNLARTLGELKERDIRVIGTSEDAEQTLYDLDLRGPVALVLGAEGPGLRQLTRKTCDELVRIPMQGAVESLNVSVAAGVCLFEAMRQRRVKAG